MKHQVTDGVVKKKACMRKERGNITIFGCFPFDDEKRRACRAAKYHLTQRVIVHTSMSFYLLVFFVFFLFFFQMR